MNLTNAHGMLKIADSKLNIQNMNVNAFGGSMLLNGLYNENIELFKDNSHSMVRIVSNENKIQHENIKQFTLENWFQNYKEMVKNRFYTIEQDKRFDESLENSLYFDKSSEWLNLIYKDDFKDIPNEIKELLISSHQILGATCMGLANKSLGLDLSEFDIAIIDEAGRATAPELLIPILRAKKVVLIGDHNQLPPTVDKQLFKDIEDDNIDKLTFEDKEVLEKSFFEELYEKIPNSNKMMLNEQFRMPKKIGDLISELFYESMLKNGHIKDSSNFIDSKNIVKWIVKNEL
jgi:superfamily I DNA and/or RNA helicase